jgi:two-component system sensor histidine kinase KdpD
MPLVESSSRARQALRWAAAFSATVLSTVLLLLLRANSTSSGMIYLILVVWFATRAGQRLSLFIALASSVLFDYYFLDPVGSFTLSGAQSWLAMIVFILSSVVVGRVAERARRETQQAEQRRADVERLYSLSQEMMLHDDAEGLVRDIPQLVERIFALDAVLLYVRDEDQLYSSIPGVSAQMRLTLRALEVSSETDAELPDGYFPMNLVFGMKSVGTLAWRPATLSLEVATSVAAQVAIALTRSLAVEASARLEAARSGDRLRNALIDSLTHELRTPLTAIRAAATTLLDGHGLDAELRNELATIVDEESARLDVLIGKAIEMAEIDADGIKVHAEPVLRRTVLDRAVEESLPLLSAHRVVIAVEGADNPVWLDPHLIGRVLRHLLENAARYTPPGTRIVMRSRRTADRVEFLVEDNGPGIDAYDLPLIFEKFYRGKRGAQAASAAGTGMGLAITRAILAAHGGRIEVTSTPGQGTTFIFWIPAVESAAELPSGSAIWEASESPPGQG